MAFSKGKPDVSLEDILTKVTEAELLASYLNVFRVPCIINSPLREDKRPSFGLYTNDGKRIFYTDLSTGDRGGIFDLLGKLWGLPYNKVLERIYNDIPKINKKYTEAVPQKFYMRTSTEYNKDTELLCKVRDWEAKDIEYWEKYGITLDWLKYAEVYPISHKIIRKNGRDYVLGADKLAYAYVERKEGKVTLKIYQPYNKHGYKWSNKHDNSVISLWTKVPETGNRICICSSLKDALCLWSNTGIPCIAVQGEGYKISTTAINELKRRYENIYILFDNDEAGLIDGEKLSKETGFTNIVLPKFEGGKDISDYYFILQDKQEFKKQMLNLFKNI